MRFRSNAKHAQANRREIVTYKEYQFRSRDRDVSFQKRESEFV
jgi:hypothetical protein